MKAETVMCLDAVGCRSNALTKRTRGLPVFCPLDEWEPYSDRTDWDFVYIDMQCRVHQGLFPYTGHRWYAAEVADFLLERCIVSRECCKAGLRATRHIPSRELEKHVEALGALCDPKFLKQGFLSAIGLWNCASQHVYKKVRSTHQIDAGPGLQRRRELEDGGFEWTTCEELVDLYSMAPWGRIALDVEQVRVAQAIDILNGLGHRVLGAYVDGVFFEGKETNCPLYFPDGSPMFQLKEEPVCKLPTWEQSDTERSRESGPSFSRRTSPSTGS
jgi:hypothetical protein